MLNQVLLFESQIFSGNQCFCDIHIKLPIKQCLAEESLSALRIILSRVSTNERYNIIMASQTFCYRMLVLHVEGVLADQMKVEEGSIEFDTDNDTHTD